MTNLVLNPSFESGIANWTSANFTQLQFPTSDWVETTPFQQSSAWSHEGTYSAYVKLTKGATTNNSAWFFHTPSGVSGMPVAVGTSYHFKLYANYLNPSALGANAVIFWYTAAGATISLQVAQSPESDDVGEREYQFVATAPATAAFATVSLFIFSATSGDVFEGYLDAVSFEALPTGYGKRGVVQDAFSGTGALTDTDTGQSYDTSEFFPASDPNARMSVIGGKMTSATTLAAGNRSYAQVTTAGEIRRIGAKFTFSNLAGDEGYIALLAGDYIEDSTSLGGTDLAIHFKTRPTAWWLEVLESGTLTTIASGTYAVTLAKDDATVHEVEILMLTDDILSVKLPDGNFRGVIASDLLGLPSGPWATFEITQANGATDTKPKFTEVWVDTGDWLYGSVNRPAFVTTAGRGQ